MNVPAIVGEGEDVATVVGFLSPVAVVVDGDKVGELVVVVGAIVGLLVVFATVGLFVGFLKDLPWVDGGLGPTPVTP